MPERDSHRRRLPPVIARRFPPMRRFPRSVCILLLLLLKTQVFLDKNRVLHLHGGALVKGHGVDVHPDEAGSAYMQVQHVAHKSPGVHVLERGVVQVGVVAEPHLGFI